MRELRGRVAVVTGGGSGIGRGICLAAAEQGMHVVVADVEVDAAEETAALVKEQGGRSLAAPVDVTDRAAVDALAAAGLRAVTLTEKEGLSLINGTDGILGMLCLACHDIAALLKLADVVGVAPSLMQCASCGRFEDLHRFSFAGGGAVCDRCRVEGSVRLRDGLTEYLAALADAEMTSLPDLDNSISGEAMGIARRFVEYHLDRKLSSLAVME